MKNSYSENFRLFVCFEFIYNYDYDFKIDLSGFEDSYIKYLLIDSIKKENNYENSIN